MHAPIVVRAPAPRPEPPQAAAAPRRSGWRSPRGRRAGAALLGAAAGAALAVAMPYGPVTTAQVAVGMLAGAVTGFAAGLVAGSRVALALAPLANLAAFELVRRPPDVPSVGRIELGSSWGILVLVLGRGVYALLVLAPTLVAAAYGAGLARRRARTPRGRACLAWPRRAVCALAALGLAGLFAYALQPASVPPVRGADGRVVAGSIATLQRVRLGGHDQWLEIRGADIRNPVLLYLSGGPGQSDLAFSRVILSDLTRRFTLVGWDQRGNGKSYPSLDPRTLTLDRAVSDAVELGAYLERRFGARRVYLLGESWGSTLAVLAAQRRPDIFAAVVSSGQMVSQRETDRRIYRDAVALAARTGDRGLQSTLLRLGEPPYRDVYGYATMMGLYDRLAGPYAEPAAYEARGRAAGLGPSGLLGSEYAFIDRVDVLRGLVDTFATLYPQLQRIDFRRDVPELHVPLYLLEGDHELAGRRSLALEWFRELRAPRKRLYAFANAGHAVAFEQFQALDGIMTTVLADTAG